MSYDVLNVPSEISRRPSIAAPDASSDQSASASEFVECAFRILQCLMRSATSDEMAVELRLGKAHPAGRT